MRDDGMPGGGRGRPPGDRRGFTLIEILLVVVIVSILAALAQPNYHRALLKARAVEVYADLDVIQKAVQEYQAEHHTWPEDRNRGQVPMGLDPYLPAGFDFEKEEYVLDYDNWTTTSGAPFQVGLTVICNDEALGRAVLEILGSNAWTDGSTKFTWIIEW